MSDLFEKLMEQIEMPLEYRRSRAFSSADIVEVKVHSVSRRWDFHFAFENLLPIELYRELEQRLVASFKRADIKASFVITVAHPEFDQELLQAYYSEAFEHPLCESAGFKATFSKLKVAYDGQTVTITGPEYADKEHFKKNHLPKLSQQFEAFGFGQLVFEVSTDKAMTEELQSSFQTNREALLEQARKDSLEAQKALEAAGPPPEEPKSAPAFDYKEWPNVKQALKKRPSLR